jgi:D-alanyl-D-alanine carboxypeptidase
MRKQLLRSIPLYVPIILLIIAAVFFNGAINSINAVTNETVANQKEQIRNELQVAAFSHITTEARGVVVYDVTNKKVLYGENLNQARPLASITKVMTAVVARTTLSQDASITITPQSRTEEYDAILRNNDTWKAKDLIQYFLISSSNDGANAACAAVTKTISIREPGSTCITLMNQYARTHELASLHFENSSGLDLKNGAASNIGSPYDVARLLGMSYATYGSLFSATKEPTATFNTGKYTYTAVNTDLVLDRIPGILMGKTGYTDMAGGNLAILYQPVQGRQIAIVVMGSSHDGRFNDMLTLIGKTTAYVKAQSYLTL